MSHAPDAARPPVYAHRFGSRYGPESSRLALEHSLEGGVEGAEIDIVLSADEEVTCVHDPFLRIATDLEGWAHETPTEAILGSRLRDESGEPSSEHPMTLIELLDRIPRDFPLQLDVKAYADPELARRTAARACEVVAEHGTGERIEVISFFTEACAAAVDAGIQALLVVWADYGPSDLADWVAEQGFSGVSVEGFILSERLCRPLVDTGLRLSVGAVNSIAQLELILPLGLDVVVSDCPLELREELEARGFRR
jgi:glycerophosphoryl diester phosphodiesterase